MSRPIQTNFDQRFLFPPALTDWISPGDPVWFVKDFVESLDLVGLGFHQHGSGKEGRPHYPADMLLRVWLFGWMERIRSPRALERACMRDVAFLFLTCNHHPDHNTLWRFFRDNEKALRKLFKRVVEVAAKAKLIGFVLHALDGTKIQAAGSMETAWHTKNLADELKRLDKLIEDYVIGLNKTAESEESGYAMPENMQQAAERKEHILKALADLEEAETKHLHPGDPDARVMKTRTHLALSYNAQIIVDHDSDLIVAADVTGDETDHAQLVPMLEHAAENLGQTAEQTVADAGYFNGEQLAAAERRHLPVLVHSKPDSQDKGDLKKENFVYDPEHDGYICPRGEFLPLERDKPADKKNRHPCRIYRCRNRQCPVRDQCTKDPRGRSIQRMHHEDAVQRQMLKHKHPLMTIALSLRKEIVEHLFAIVKSVDGFRRFTVCGIESVKAQWALACTAVNLRKMYAFWRQGRLPLAA